MTLKKIICLALAALMLFSVVACNGNDGATTETTDTTGTTGTTGTTDTTGTTGNNGGNTNPENEDLPKKVYSIIDNLDKIKVYGRGTQANGGITADWSASGIEFNVYAEGMIRIYGTATSSVKFAVYVDGKLMSSEMTMITGTDYKAIVVRGLTRGEHNIRVVRKTMPESGNTGRLVALTNIEVYGELRERPADKDLMIEFVGDSITCGYGVLGQNDNVELVIDGSRTWAVKVAEKLNADYSAIAVSGIGVYLGTDRHNNVGLSMSSAYDLNCWYRSKSVRYEPTRKADIVVVNLNTNDNARIKKYIDDGIATEEELKAGYVAAAKLLLQKIREVNGEDVKILWVGGMMSNPSSAANVRADAWIQEIFEELGGEAAGYYLKMDLIRDTSGAAGHPVENTHNLNATLIANFIRDNML